MPHLPHKSLPDIEDSLDIGIRKILRPVPYLPTKSFVLCGERSAGKTTFIANGLSELAQIKFYRSSDVRKFEGEFNSQTKDFTRFALRRNSKLGSVDCWIDADGLHFSNIFFKKGSNSKSKDDNKGDKAFKRFIKKGNAMLLVVSAQRLLDLKNMFMNPETKKDATNVYNEYKKGIETYKPTIPKKILRRGFKLHVFVTQAGDIVDNQAEWDDLLLAIEKFFLKTGLHWDFKRAILVDSCKDPLLDLGHPVAVLGQKKSHGRGCKLEAKIPEGAKVCSAGVAMAYALGKLALDKQNPFVFSYDDDSNMD